MELVIKNLLGGAVLATAFTLASTANAAPTVDIAFGNDLFPEGFDTLTFDFNDGNNSRSARVNAGMFGGKATNGVDFDPTTLYRNESDVLLYCVDILTNLETTSTTYQVNDVAANLVVGDGQLNAPRRDFGRMLDFLGAANTVLADTGYELDFADKNWLNPTSGWMSGAIQVGIWESLYEKEGATLAVGGGDFEITSGLDSRGASLLTSVFGAMDGTDSLDANQVKWFSTDAGQDLVGDPQEVPVPAPLALLVGGLGLLAMRGRRRHLA
jgi:hypothetical protein